MALSRKFLSALGIEADKIDEIITAHSDTVDALKEQRDSFEAEAKRYKEDADKLADVQKELDELKKDSSKDDYAKLKKEYEDYKVKVEEEKERARKETAYREILKDAGIAEKNMAKVLKYTDFGEIELGDDGKIVDAKKCIKAVKEEWPELIVTESTEGAKTSTPPNNTGGNAFEKMSLAEKMVYANENPNNEDVKAWLK